MGLLRTLRDQESGLSLARRLRARRFALFRELVDRLPRPVAILDVGGTEAFWETMGFLDPAVVRITILNLDAPRPRHESVTTVAGNACDMGLFDDGRFDVVFSNSVIEHVGDPADQAAMAREVQRVGQRYFVQTPNRYFPIEPHFMFPWFQFLPLRAQAWLLMNLSLSWGGRIRDRERAEHTARSVRLLSGRELGALFPGAELNRERVLGLTKSWTAYKGW